MLERLKISEYSFISDDKIKIWIQDDLVHYSVSIMEKGRSVKDKIADCSPEELSTMLEDAQIKNWKKQYMPEDLWMDGVEWSLEYKEAGEKAVRIKGSNAWPPEWEKLLEAVKKVAGNLGGMEESYRNDEN